MKFSTPLALLALISTASALPAWFGESPESSSSAGIVQTPGYQNSSSTAPTSSLKKSHGVYTLPYSPHTTSSHSFVYETTLYGPTGPHTHSAFQTPKIYTEPAVSTASA